MAATRPLAGLDMHAAHRSILLAGWEISPDQIEICQTPDGSEWLLGEGRYGQVFKALKGGIQVRVPMKAFESLNLRLPVVCSACTVGRRGSSAAGPIRSLNRLFLSSIR